MLTEHVTIEDLAAVRTGNLSAGDLLDVDSHVAECPRCRELLMAQVDVDPLLRSLEALLDDADGESDEHLSYEQITAFIDARLDGAARQAVEAHVATCSRCRDDLLDLRTFDERMVQQGLTAEIYTAERADPDASERSRQGSSRRRAIFWDLFFGTNRAQTVLAFAVVILAIGLGAGTRQYQSLTASLEALREEAGRLRDGANVLKSQNESLQARAEALEGGRPSGLPAGAAVVIDKGGAISLGNGSVVLTTSLPMPESVAASVRDLVTTGEVTLLASAALTPALNAVIRGGSTSGLGAGPEPVAPVFTLVRTPAVTFRWRAVPEAREYKAMVSDADGRVVWETTVSALTATPPQDLLHAGATYFWLVEAFREGVWVEGPSARFGVLDKATSDQVSNIDRVFKDSALIRAATYASQGLYDDALEQVNQLAATNPSHPQIRKLQASLKRQLHRE